ncbi:unannotated protein [freshwater metagenome]|uniref:Unannotated protein n=1 Tax=freshwater metagenome TaxID=449393 RepID=A0A6J7HNJ5_9ZZZZ
MMRDASAPADLRTGAPFSPVISLSSGGSQSATVRAPWGEPSSVISSQGAPMSRPAARPGSEVVALARTNTGDAP